MANEHSRGPENLYATSMLEGGRNSSRRSAVQSRKAEEDMADLSIARKRLAAIKNGRSTIVSGEALDKALHEILDS